MMKKPIHLLQKTAFPAVLLAILLPSLLQAEDGYQLWLRDKKIDDAQLLQTYSGLAGEIVVQGDSPTLSAIREELHQDLSGLLGSDVALADKVTQNGAVLVGTPASSPLIAALNLQADLNTQGDDGYIVRSVTSNNNTVTVIASKTETGALYGAFHFLRLLQTQQDISHLDISEKPKFQRRLLNHWDNLNGSVERGYAGKSIWQWDDLPGKVDPRYKDYARANASIGINGAILNNVNAKPEQLDAEHIKKAAAIADVLRPYGIHVYLSANFAAPKSIGGLSTADPLDPAVQAWWKAKADEIYGLIPDFGGFLVKANSEGQPGPRDYHRTHADGANALADAVAPHGGVVMWRCFVYGGAGDRAMQAYKEFKPLDGAFHSNVFLQVKNGPIDFQPREMFHPLYGALPKTPIMPELEITQENTGHSTDLVYLANMWKEFLDSDTYVSGQGTTVASIAQGYPINGMAGVANIGTDRNWCGHDFAQANWYAFGRLAWNSSLTTDQIAEEWIRMTWSNDPKVVSTIQDMMRGSWEAMVSYEMPIGLTHIMEGGDHYAPAPKQFQDYHRADEHGIGYDRSSTGSNAVSEYAPEVGNKYNDLATCPDNLLLWFHHVPWDYKMKSDRTVWEELCFRYNDGVNDVKNMQKQWGDLRGKVDTERFTAVQKKLDMQLAHAKNWRDTCLHFFQDFNHLSYAPPADDATKH